MGRKLIQLQRTLKKLPKHHSELSTIPGSKLDSMLILPAFSLMTKLGLRYVMSCGQLEVASYYPKLQAFLKLEVFLDPCLKMRSRC